jgi:hypothetical protein
MRKQWIRRVVLAAVFALVYGPVWADPPSTILLVDDYHVLYRPGTRRVLHPLTRHPANPMIPTDKPWEVDGTVAYCSVHVKEDGTHQLWYQAWTGKGPVYLCYAESQDGLVWTKPNLGLHAFEGSTDTNIVMTITYGGSVIFDPRDPDPARRYKSAYWGGRSDDNPHPGTFLAFSPDGISWTKHPDNPIIRGSHGEYIQPPFEGDPVIESGTQGPPLSTSDVIDLIWDSNRDVYAIYAKTWLDGPDGRMHWKRAVVRTESQDFKTWTKPRLVMAPDEHEAIWSENETSLTTSGGGSGGVQLHSGPAFAYRDMYFSMVQVMDPGDTGLMPTELALSHDGYSWRRPFRKTYFIPPLKDSESFDASLIWSNATPVFLEKETRFYYGAYGKTWNSNDVYQSSGVGLATMPRDRFAGVLPFDKVGQITMKALDLRDLKSMTVNADAGKGSVRVEVLNADGYRVRGFSKDDAVAIKGDDLDHPVAWNEKSVADLPDGKYKLRLHLEKSEVFALSFVK